MVLTWRKNETKNGAFKMKSALGPTHWAALGVFPNRKPSTVNIHTPTDKNEPTDKHKNPYSLF
jgi:hypothetical protein